MKELEPISSPIRPANLGDIKTLGILINAGVKEGGLLPRSPEEVERLIDNFFVVEQNGMVVGCAGLDIYTPKIAELRSLYVLPEARKQGFATQLIQTCLEKARMKGIKEVITISNQEYVFRRAGFSDQIGEQKAMFIRI